MHCIVQEYRSMTGAMLAVDRSTVRFPFIEKIVADDAYAGSIAQSNSQRMLLNPFALSYQSC